ncbi:MAG: hypothetical protein ACKO9I_19545 [Sphaerospermopsis kisseleviana]
MCKRNEPRRHEGHEEKKAGEQGAGSRGKKEKVPSHQSPVTSHQSPVPSPQSPIKK